MAVGEATQAGSKVTVCVKRMVALISLFLIYKLEIIDITTQFRGFPKL